MNYGGERTDAERRPPSRTVVETVADREGISPKELASSDYESLHDVIDPRALDGLFAPKHDGAPRGSGRVTFQWCGYRVTVDRDGSVVLGRE